MKKGIVLIVTAFLLALSFFALAEDLPVVNDAASVLDTTTIQDIQQLNQQMEKALDISLRVETKDFLGGEQPAQYARALREGSDKADKTILLVSHRPAALNVCDTRLTLSGGKIRGETLDNEWTRKKAT